MLRWHAEAADARHQNVTFAGEAVAMKRSVAVIGVLALVLAACGAQTPDVASPTPVVNGVAPETQENAPEPTRTAPPTPDAARFAVRAAYIDAMCPIFLDILVLDPRLAAMRADGAAPTEILTDATEVEAVTADLRGVLNDLNTVPNWTPGQLLRHELIGALHNIRVALVGVADEIDGPDAADRLAGIPYIASRQMDQAMIQAASAGLSCDGYE
jgi:hypothetical protein